MSLIKKVILGFVVSWMFAFSAWANLMISPTRVVFEPGQRSTTIVVINNSQETNSYRFELEDKLQKPDGSYEALDKNNAHKQTYSASDLIRFSPRQVTLAPGESQKIRISARPQPGMANGEYRTHFSFSALPKPQAIDNKEGQAGFMLFMLMSFTIPVQVQVGQVSVDVAIDQMETVKLADAVYAFRTHMSRSGNASAFGKVELLWRANQSESFAKLTEQNNVAFYRELDKRFLDLELKKQDFKPGFYKIVYKGDDRVFNNRVLAEKEVYIDKLPE